MMASGRSGTAIVVGGGIGGLATAVALERAGWKAEVYERAPELGEVGAGVTLAPNAIKALRALGLEESLTGIVCDLDGLEARSRSGRRITRIDASMLRSRYDAGFQHAHRAELHRMLREALKTTEIRTGCTAVRVSTGPSSAAVDFEHSESAFTREADLVVAADGVRSRSRQSLFGGYPGPTYAGYTVWRGLVPVEAARRIGVPARLTETWGVAARFGTAPIGDGRAYWYAFENAEAGAEHEHRVEPLADRFADWHEPIPALIESTPEEMLLRGDVHYLAEPLPSFVKGRAVLIGDAAHAVTPDIGQGACLAIEDAVALAAELTRAGTAEGLRAFDAARRPRTQRIAAQSGKLGRMLMRPGRTAAAVRDVTASLMPASISMKSIADIYDWTPPSPGPV